MKKQINVTTSDETLRRVDALATRWELSRSAVITMLVSKAYLDEFREVNA